MTTVTDSIIFRHIFSTPESSKIWSDETRTKYYLQFEACLAIVQARFGMIPVEAAEAIEARCKIEMIDMEELAEETLKIGYPVLPLVKQVVRMANGVKPGLGEWAHWGATTQVCRVNCFPTGKCIEIKFQRMSRTQRRSCSYAIPAN
jgi:3-carboxy-cis,cis-muconate cycloisomerase